METTKTRQTTETRTDEQLTRDLQIIEQINERWADNERANKVMQENADNARNK